MFDRRARERFLGNRAGVAGGVIVLLLLAFAVAGPWVTRRSPLESDFVHGVAFGGMPVAPSARFWLGTDRLFRDVWARLACAARLSLLIALGSTVLATAIGAVVGVVAGYTEGRRVRLPWPALVGGAGALGALALGRPWLALAVFAVGLLVLARSRPDSGAPVDLDGALMRVVDVLLAFPFLLLVMAIGAAVDRTSAATIFVTLGATSWQGIARVMRAKTMQVRSLEYVTASRALGQSTARIIVRHVLPNVAGPLLVSATMQVAQMVIAESVLSYLGVGISPPTPTWGRMLYEGQDYYLAAPWLVAAPAGVIVLCVWGFNVLGEGLRDAIDPHEA